MSLYFALIFVNSCPSPLLIAGSICEPDLPFSQPIGPVFVPLLPGWYHSPVFTKRASHGHVVFYHAELIVHFILLRLNSIMSRGISHATQAKPGHKTTVPRCDITRDDHGGRTAAAYQVHPFCI